MSSVAKQLPEVWYQARDWLLSASFSVLGCQWGDLVSLLTMLCPCVTFQSTAMVLVWPQYIWLLTTPEYLCTLLFFFWLLKPQAGFRALDHAAPCAAVNKPEEVTGVFS